MVKKRGIHFEISERKILLRIMDLVGVFVALYIVGTTFTFDYFTLTSESWIWSVVLGVYISIFGTVFELYDLKRSSELDSTFRNVVLTISTTVLIYLLTPVITPFLPDKRMEIVYFFLTMVGGIYAGRVAYVTLIASPRFYKKVLIIGEVANVHRLIENLSSSDPNYKIVGFVNSESETEDRVSYKGVEEYPAYNLAQVINEEQISEIVVAIYDTGSITPDIYNQLTLLLEQGFPIREYTQVFEEITKRVPVQYVGKDFYRYFPFSRSHQNKMYLLYHRLMDILGSVVGLVFGLMIVPFILLLNLFWNRGPLFYTQDRIGKNGAIFRILKFRTMIPDDERRGARWTEKGDKRITPFGRFLRNTRLDEIPQFVNVLKGEMSIIGPRPERPFLVRELSMIMPFYETRHAVKPGLTGWAQVNHPYGETVEDSLEKLQYDLYYIKHRSFFLDLNILVKTFSTVLYYRGQ